MTLRGAGTLGRHRSILFAALLSACGPTVTGDLDAAFSDGTTVPDATACTMGQQRCIGNTFEQCVGGTYEVSETCLLDQLCDPTRGCIALPNPCRVNDDIDGVPVCTKRALPDSFQPETQWMWPGSGADVYSIVAPLVANLTDDDNSGEIDLCDTPDVVVVASPSFGTPGQPGHIYLLDGATGLLHTQFAQPVDHTVTPALGDIDGDGIPEIVTAVVGGALVAFEHDGTVKWTSTVTWGQVYSGAIALADMDNDGDVEIVAGNMLFDHLGNHLWTAGHPSGNWSATAIADMDGDGDLEMVLGAAVYQHNGQLLFATNLAAGYPSIANMDADPEPEIIVTNINGISMLEHNGIIKFSNLRPTGAPTGFTTWLRPSTVHDFDGDTVSEFAVSSGAQYAVYEANATILWQATVSDSSGIAAGTAFDFLGDGVAEAMYADENNMFVFDGAGLAIFQTPRASGTLSEYPVVADIDNDGSAEIVVVSNRIGNVASPTVQVIRDVQDRWIQARRIWNQHTYHVTNVREDGTIPQFEKPSWETLNTFRTNAQIEGGGVCEPIVE